MDNDEPPCIRFTDEEDAMTRWIRGLAALAAAGAMLGCGGQEGTEQDAPAETAATTPTPSPTGSTANPSEITAEMVALGNEIFHGRAANAICYTCHGMDATGGPGGLGPNLTDAEWLHNDGSYGAIVNTIRTGVAQPVNASAPMPPMGGASLSDEQLRAVAAYVYSLTHPEVPQASSG
jgi:mono/diheme cytochrome c family protein